MKAKLYQILGFIFTVLFGTIGYIVNLCQPHKFQRFIENPSRELIPAVYGSLGAFAFNPFLWIGLILLWRADRNKNPEKNSRWGKLLKIYSIFTAIMLLITLLFILLGRK